MTEKRSKKHFSWKRKFVLFFLFCASLGTLLFSLLLIVVLGDLPDITDERALIFSESTVIYDSEGVVQLYAVHGDQNRKIIPIEEMSRNIISAILAAEDDGFYTHSGFDVGGITMAFCHEILGNVFGLCPPRGGSTITQQLVKNFFLTPERTLPRKLRELVLAYKIEGNHSKDKILEIYLNGISFGANLSGVETASQAFFHVSAKNLSPAQAAVLASIPQAPTKYSPFGENVSSRLLLSEEIIEKNKLSSLKAIEGFSSNSWKQGLIGKEITLADGTTDYFPGRADWVLWRMKSLGFLSEEVYKEAGKELSEMTFDEYHETLTAPHFIMWIREKLEERFGADLVEHGGLKVYTTIDVHAQELAEKAIEKQIKTNTEKYNAKNAALIAIEPKTGFIRAMVGSADYWNEEIDGKVNVILKKRLPGSSFKPIAYAASFLSGRLSPASILFDVETDFGNGWKPKNYDGLFRGPISVRNALGHSLNIPAVKATIIAGSEKVYELATNMGISFDFPADFYGAAIALGGAEARPMDMAIAFSVFANGGKKVEPIGVLRVEDRYGNLLYSAETTEEPEEVLDPSIAYLITDMLSDTGARGEGWNRNLQLLGRQNIAKTGTADKKVDDVPWPADCWTIGGTPQLMTAVWTGNSSGEVLGRNADGLNIAAPIWHTFMTEVLADTEPENFEVPKNVSRIQVSQLSGLLPLPGTKQNLITDEIFSSLNAPTKTDNSLVMVKIDAVSGKLITKDTPEESIQEKAVLNMHSYYPDWPQWEQPVQEWLAEHKEEFLARFDIENDILAEIPEGEDDVHSAKTKANAPEISFISPKHGGGVASPRTTVMPEISAKNGFQKIIFSWNGRILKSFDQQQDEYIIQIPRSATGKNTLSMKVIDDLFYSAEKSVDVEIGEDTDIPSIEILKPRNGEQFLGGSRIVFSVKASDRTGAVQKVEFFVDNEKVGSSIFAPYEYKWKSTNISGEHTLKAVVTDRAGNITKESVSFGLKKQRDSEIFGIADPKNDQIFSCSQSIWITAGVANETRNDFNSLEIWGEGPKKLKTSIAEFNELSETGYFETEFTPDVCGQWKFYVKVTLQDGGKRTSAKTEVEFE